MKGLIAVILLAIGGVAVEAADAEMRGDWLVSPAAASPYAVTANESRHLFGQFCYPADGHCYWALSTDTVCVKGDRYPVLINSEAGALSTEVLCDVLLDGGKQKYFFTNFDDIDRLVRSSSRMGVAFPLKEGAFVVVRFSLTGAVGALDAMRAEASRRRAVPTGSTRDQKL